MIKVLFLACTHGASPFCVSEISVLVFSWGSPWAQDLFSVCLTLFIFNEQLLSNTAIPLGLDHANGTTCGPLGVPLVSGLGTDILCAYRLRT